MVRGRARRPVPPTGGARVDGPPADSTRAPMAAPPSLARLRGVIPNASGGMEMGSNLLSGGPLSDGLLIAAVAVLVIARQLMPRQVRLRAMVAVPLVAGYLGLQALAKTPPDGTLAVTLLGANLLVGALTGLVR